jgi:hypothetical protein
MVYDQTEVMRMWLAMGMCFALGMAVFTTIQAIYPKAWSNLMERIIEWFTGDR